jgi:hypothetical protein
MRRTSRKIWSDRVRRWKASGLAAKKFAARQGLTAGSLYRWSWRLRAEERGRKAGRTSEAPPVVEIVGAVGVVGQDPQSGAPEPFEVLLGERVRILVPVRFDAEALVRLVAILERR